jgi:hypothetical protein
VFGKSKLGVGVELSNSSKMDVTTEDSDSERLVNSKILQIFDYDRSLLLVVLGSPVVVEIIQDFNTTIDVVEGLAQDTSASKCLDGVHESGGQTKRKSVSCLSISS